MNANYTQHTENKRRKTKKSLNIQNIQRKTTNCTYYGFAGALDTKIKGKGKMQTLLAISVNYMSKAL